MAYLLNSRAYDEVCGGEYEERAGEEEGEVDRRHQEACSCALARADVIQKIMEVFKVVKFLSYNRGQNVTGSKLGRIQFV